MQTTPLELTEFSRRVIAHRKRMAYTQAQLAALLCISRPQMCHIERGRHWPSIQVYVKICDVLNLRVPPLFEKAA